MELNNVELATKLKSDMDTLKLECDQILVLVQAKRPNPYWLFNRILKNRPTEKTYKGFFCSSYIDSIGSTVLINPREAEAVLRVKEQEIKEIEQQILNLE